MEVGLESRADARALHRPVARLTQRRTDGGVAGGLSPAARRHDARADQSKSTSREVQPVEPRPSSTRGAWHALEQTRLAGHRGGLVVMATGLGKTWLAAFDTARPQFGRVLFVAHREEILRQSRDVFRQVHPDSDLGLYYGRREESRGRLRLRHRADRSLADSTQFAPDAFDYIVVDEFHHAAAPTYREIIDHFAPAFLLGLTATPDRMDGADCLALCGDNLVFRCDLVEGIRREELVPFPLLGRAGYRRLRADSLAQRHVRSGSTDAAVETQERAQQAFDEWRRPRGQRDPRLSASPRVTRISWPSSSAQHGVRAVRCTAGRAARRATIARGLRDGELEVIFAVDLFNEGLDVPDMDTVLMLRPTESPVVFLQQLGRGLRTSRGQDAAHRRRLHRQPP